MAKITIFLSFRGLRNIFGDDSTFIFNVNTRQLATSKGKAGCISPIILQTFESNSAQSFLSLTVPITAIISKISYEFSVGLRVVGAIHEFSKRFQFAKHLWMTDCFIGNRSRFSLNDKCLFSLNGIDERCWHWLCVFEFWLPSSFITSNIHSCETSEWFSSKNSE
jgi:hypothetical protein